MKLTYSNGSIFESGATAIVNPVNCVGVMGGGLAKAFAERYPLMLMDYEEYCDRGLLRPGMVHSYYSNLEEEPIILNLPTKDDWKNPSTLEYVHDGLTALATYLNRFSIDSVAVPALGCGLGGLAWEKVDFEISMTTSLTPNTNWIVFPPQ
jgi:O-acetyl-ADP-ribose deacetylase (regulator of RNase III)